MLTIQHVENAFDNVEHIMIHTAIKATPWLADLPVAYLTYRNFSQVLDFPGWIALGAGVAVEGLGLACASTAMKFRRYNQTKGSKEPPAPEMIAWGTVVAYFGSSLVMSLLGTFTQLGLYAILTFPIMGILGTLVHAMELDHRGRIQANAAAKVERKETREANRKQKAIEQQALAQAEAVAAPAEQDLAQDLPQPSTREQVLDYFLRNPLATQQDAAQVIGVSRQAIGDHLRKLQESGAIKRNGHGVEAIA